MDYQNKTDQLFQHLREEPVDIPFEKMEKFILAQTITGIAAAGAVKGIFGLKKLALTFHLNTLIVMTSAISASILGLFLWSSHHTATTAAAKPALHTRTNVSAAFKEPEAEKEQLVLPPDTPAVAKKSQAAGTGNSNTSTTTTIVTSGGKSTSVSVSTGTNTNTNTSAAASDTSYSYSTVENEDGTTASVITVGDNVISISTSTEDLSGMGPVEPVIKICTPVCNHSDSLVRKITNALVSDGLISDPTHFKFKIDGNSVKVNGKKQSDEVWKRYKQLIEQNSRNKVNHSFSFELAVDDDNTTLNVENYTD